MPLALTRGYPGPIGEGGAGEKHRPAKLNRSALLLLCVVDELEEQAGYFGRVAHVRPSHMRLAVWAVGNIDVVAVEGSAGLATGHSRPEVPRLGRVRGRRADGRLRARDLHQCGVVVGAVRGAAVVVEDADVSVRRVDVDPREPLVTRGRIDERRVAPGGAAVR